MPFDSGAKFMVDYTTTRNTEIREGQRISWALKPTAKLSELVDIFKRDDENAKYVDKVGNNPATSPFVNEGMAVRLFNRIGWLAGCMRCMRAQYLSGNDSHARPPFGDDARHAASELKWESTFMLPILKTELKDPE